MDRYIFHKKIKRDSRLKKNIAKINEELIIVYKIIARGFDFMDCINDYYLNILKGKEISYNIYEEIDFASGGPNQGKYFEYNNIQKDFAYGDDETKRSILEQVNQFKNDFCKDEDTLNTIDRLNMLHLDKDEKENSIRCHSCYRLKDKYKFYFRNLGVLQ